MPPDVLNFEDVREENLTIGTSWVLLVRARRHKELSIQNVSTGGQIMELRFGEGNSGRLVAYLNGYDGTSVNGFEVYQGDIFVRMSAIGGTVHVFDR